MCVCVCVCLCVYVSVCVCVCATHVLVCCCIHPTLTLLFKFNPVSHCADCPIEYFLFRWELFPLGILDSDRYCDFVRWDQLGFFFCCDPRLCPLGFQICPFVGILSVRISRKFVCLESRSVSLGFCSWGSAGVLSVGILSVGIS